MFDKEGIVLKTVDFKENSKIIYLLTANGIDSTLVRSVKKSVSKDKAATNILTRITYQTTKSKGLSTLISFDVLNSYSSLKKDIDSVNYLSLILEVTYKLSLEIDTKELYFFLVKLLSVVEKEQNHKVLTDVFLIKYLYLHGINPNFKSCVYCNETTNLQTFSIEKGGVLCDKHSTHNTDFDLVSYLTNCYYTDIFSVNFKHNEKGLDLIMKYYKYHLNYDFVAYSLIKSLM